MGAVRVHKRVLRWGNSFGIRLTRRDLERLHLEEGMDVDVDLEPCAPEIDWNTLPLLALGRDASIRHDGIILEGLAEDEEKA